MDVLSSSQPLDDILYNLDRFQTGPIKKRIVNELVEFKAEGAYIHSEYRENFNHFNKSAIVITIIPFQKDDIFNFTITKDYPFVPPIDFSINYKKYTKYLKIESSKTLNELREFNGINCLCCKTIACGQNWGPALRMYNFISEYYKIKKYRRDIINRLLSAKIIEKYLISDINLLEWLI